MVREEEEGQESKEVKKNSKKTCIVYHSKLMDKHPAKNARFHSGNSAQTSALCPWTNY